MKNKIVDTNLNTSIKNAKRILSLPMYPELEDKEIEYENRPSFLKKFY